MARRTFVDMHGDRWEVEQSRTEGDGTARAQPAFSGGTFTFRNPDTGMQYETPALRSLDDTTDDQLREELHRARDQALGRAHD